MMDFIVSPMNSLLCCAGLVVLLVWYIRMEMKGGGKNG